jgi:type I restriction enzyme M protein
MEACIVICRMDKPRGRRNRILFINAVNEVTRERAQSFLAQVHIDKTVSAYRSFEEIPGFSKVGTLDEIRANKGVLNVPLYVRPNDNDGVGSQEASLPQVIANWQTSSDSLRASMDALFDTLAEAGFDG